MSNYTYITHKYIHNLHKHMEKCMLSVKLVHMIDIIRSKCYSYYQAFNLVLPEPRAAESIAGLSFSKWDML